jgi:hypothetical protein
MQTALDASDILAEKARALQERMVKEREYLLDLFRIQHNHWNLVQRKDAQRLYLVDYGLRSGEWAVLDSPEGWISVTHGLLEHVLTQCTQLAGSQFDDRAGATLSRRRQTEPSSSGPKESFGESDVSPTDTNSTVSTHIAVTHSDHSVLQASFSSSVQVSALGEHPAIPLGSSSRPRCAFVPFDVSEGNRDSRANFLNLSVWPILPTCLYGFFCFFFPEMDGFSAGRRKPAGPLYRLRRARHAVLEREILKDTSFLPSIHRTYENRLAMNLINNVSLILSRETSAMELEKVILDFFFIQGPCQIHVRHVN